MLAKYLTVHLLLFGILAVPFERAAGAGQAPRLPRLEDADADTVFRELLTNQWPVSYHLSKRWIIQDETALFQGCGDSIETVGHERQGALAGFQAENRTPKAVLAGRALGRQYQVVSKAMIDRAFSPSGWNWDGFYRTYPDSGGYLRLSAVGFAPAEPEPSCTWRTTAGCSVVVAASTFSRTERDGGNQRPWFAAGGYRDLESTHEAEWLVGVAHDPGLSIVRRLFHKPKIDDLLAVARNVDDVLQRSAGDVRNIEWWHEPQTGTPTAHPE